MAHEKQRTFHPDRRVIEAVVEDDFGHQQIVSAYHGQHRCPSCGQELPTRDGQVDFDALVQKVCQQLDAEIDDVLAFFERHGADVSKEKARRDERRKNQAGDAGRNPDPAGSNQS